MEMVSWFGVPGRQLVVQVAVLGSVSAIAGCGVIGSWSKSGKAGADPAGQVAGAVVESGQAGARWILLPRPEVQPKHYSLKGGKSLTIKGRQRWQGEAPSETTPLALLPEAVRQVGERDGEVLFLAENGIVMSAPSPSAAISEIMLPPSPNVSFGKGALTGSWGRKGVFRSVDGGRSWNGPIGNVWGVSVRIDSKGHGILVNGSNSVQVTLDDGLTWKAVEIPDFAASQTEEVDGRIHAVSTLESGGQSRTAVLGVDGNLTPSSIPYRFAVNAELRKKAIARRPTQRWAGDRIVSVAWEEIPCTRDKCLPPDLLPSPNGQSGASQLHSKIAVFVPGTVPQYREFPVKADRPFEVVGSGQEVYLAVFQELPLKPGDGAAPQAFLPGEAYQVHCTQDEGKTWKVVAGLPNTVTPWQLDASTIGGALFAAGPRGLLVIGDSAKKDVIHLRKPGAQSFVEETAPDGGIWVTVVATPDERILALVQQGNRLRLRRLAGGSQNPEWLGEIPLKSETGEALQGRSAPRLAAEGDMVSVVWPRGLSGSGEAIFHKSMDGGKSFVSGPLLYAAHEPRFGAPLGRALPSLEEVALSGKYGLAIKRSGDLLETSDGGATWYNTARQEALIQRYAEVAPRAYCTTNGCVVEDDIRIGWDNVVNIKVTQPVVPANVRERAQIPPDGALARAVDRVQCRSVGGSQRLYAGRARGEVMKTGWPRAEGRRLAEVYEDEAGAVRVAGIADGSGYSVVDRVLLPPPKKEGKSGENAVTSARWIPENHPLGVAAAQITCPRAPSPAEQTVDKLRGIVDCLGRAQSLTGEWKPGPLPDERDGRNPEGAAAIVRQLRTIIGGAPEKVRKICQVQDPEAKLNAIEESLKSWPECRYQVAVQRDLKKPPLQFSLPFKQALGAIQKVGMIAFGEKDMAIRIPASGQTMVCQLSTEVAGPAACAPVAWRGSLDDGEHWRYHVDGFWGFTGASLRSAAEAEDCAERAPGGGCWPRERHGKQGTFARLAGQWAWADSDNAVLSWIPLRAPSGTRATQVPLKWREVRACSAADRALPLFNTMTTPAFEIDKKEGSGSTYYRVNDHGEACMEGHLIDYSIIVPADDPKHAFQVIRESNAKPPRVMIQPMECQVTG